MALVEKEVTLKNVELADTNEAFHSRREYEQKLVADNPGELYELFGTIGTPIEQIYLSSPDDEFSLRLRSTYYPEGTEYTATLKDRGKLENGALNRLEINTPLSKEAYELLAANQAFPRLRKQRAEPVKGMTIDFIAGDNGIESIVEIEHSNPTVRTHLMETLESLVHSPFTDLTGDKRVDNETIAYRLSNEVHQPHETLDQFCERVVNDIVASYVSGKNQVIVGLTGMSGSGKSTATKAIQEKITELYGEDYTPAVVSTDDYHFGKKKLEEMYGAPWTAWDDPRTYNTVELAHDLELAKNGAPLMKRHFDFNTEEVMLDEEMTPSPFIIVEGLYAGSKDLSAVRDLHFELPTGIATSIGRDVRRLVIENRANRVFPTPESRLQYQLETALPLYLNQERPGPQSFAASARPLAERAFMLYRLEA